MFGYNYDELLYWAERFKEKLLEHRRIKEVFVNAEFSWFKDDYEEYAFVLRNDRLIAENIQPYQLYEQLHTLLGNRINAGSLTTPAETERVKLKGKLTNNYDIVDMLNVPMRFNNNTYTLGESASMKKSHASK